MIALKLDVQVDDATLKTAGRQVPFAISKAINASLLKAQIAQRTHMDTRFTIRKKDYRKLSVKITKFSNQTTSLEGEIAIAPPGNSADIFGKFETGEEKVPHAGREHIAVPRVGSIVKPRKRSIVPDQLRPGELQRHPLLSLRTFVKPFKGQPSRLGIFGVERAAEARMHRNRKTAGRVLKRDANKARPRLLYTLVSKAEIDDRLQFAETVVGEVRRVFADEFDAAFAAAIRTAR